MMTGWAKMIVPAIVIWTLTLSAVGVYLRYGRLGLVLTCIGAVLFVVAGILEGICTALLGRLLDRWRKR